MYRPQFGAVLKPAGLDHSKGILSAGYQMDVTDPQWDSHPGMQKYRAFMAKYYPEADRFGERPLTAYNTSTALVEVLKRCGEQSHARKRHEGGGEYGFRDQHLYPGNPHQDFADGFLSDRTGADDEIGEEKWELFGPIIDGHAE